MPSVSSRLTYPEANIFNVAHFGYCESMKLIRDHCEDESLGGNKDRKNELQKVEEAIFSF